MGSVIAFFGLFFMHGATASAAEVHCAALSPILLGHEVSAAHSNTGEIGPASSDATESPALAMASTGVADGLHSEHAGGLCVAILLTGLMAFLISRVRAQFRVSVAGIHESAMPVNGARPPPGPQRTMLSIWRN
jgi:hypothetical protein